MAGPRIRHDYPPSDVRLSAAREKGIRASLRLLVIAHALEGMTQAEAARLAGMERQALHDAICASISSALTVSTIAPVRSAGATHSRSAGSDEGAHLARALVGKWWGQRLASGRPRQHTSPMEVSQRCGANTNSVLSVRHLSCRAKCAAACTAEPVGWQRPGEQECPRAWACIQGKPLSDAKR